jgi:hypothetical protein
MLNSLLRASYANGWRNIAITLIDLVMSVTACYCQSSLDESCEERSAQFVTRPGTIVTSKTSEVRIKMRRCGFE